MIYVIVTTTCKPGKRDEVLKAYNERAAIVRAEEGCLDYGANIDVPGGHERQVALGPDTYMGIEKWASKKLFEEHLANQQTESYRAKTQHLIASRSINILEPG